MANCQRVRQISRSAVPIKPVQQAQPQAVLGSCLMACPQVIKVTQGSPPAMLDSGLGARRPLRVLLAEDNLVSQKVAQQLLRRLGYQVDLVTNGLEVLDALRYAPYDVILMDVQMPAMDGLETTRQIHQHWQPQDCPCIIAMTAHNRDDDRARCLESGMGAYLSKPLQMKALVEAIGQCFANVQTGVETTRQTSAASANMTIDLTAFQAFVQQVGGDSPEFLLDLGFSYLESATALVQTLAIALVNGDRAALVYAAHTLKSSSASVCAMPLAKLCEVLEDILRSDDGVPLATQVEHIQTEYDRVQATLQSFLLHYGGNTAC